MEDKYPHDVLDVQRLRMTLMAWSYVAFSGRDVRIATEITSATRFL